MLRVAASLTAMTLLILGASLPARGKALDRVTSPDGAIEVQVGLDQFGAPVYRVSYHGTPVLADSHLGLRFREQTEFHRGFRLAEGEHSSHDQTWEQPWGERRLVRDHHNELRVRFESTEPPERAFLVRFRVFDDGMGFRYEVPEQPGYGQVDIVEELSEFHIAGDATAWWIPARGWNRYEYLYRHTPLSAIDRANTPMTLEHESGTFLSLHEAALVDYSGYVLDQGRDRVFQTDLTPWSDGVRVKTRTPFKSPWRTVQITAKSHELLNSSLILNLNEPNALGDVSWVKPGKYMGIWWDLHLNRLTWGSGDRHGATTERTVALMDFAAEHGFDGVLVEGWNPGWDGDWFNNGDQFEFLTAYPDFDIEAVAAHGREVGVRLIGHHETSGSVSHYETQMEAAYDWYQSLGVTQIKTGYVADGGDIKRRDAEGVAHYEWHDGQFMVDHHLRVLKAAAQRKISINAHEPVKDTGLRRTYPNWLSREGARGQEFNAFGQPQNSPEHTTILPFTRMLAGPMDFTPGVFEMRFERDGKQRQMPTTIAKQLALYVVLYSPIQMAVDSPATYRAHPEAFQFIEDVGTDWERSVALDGAIGDYVVVARQRRGGDDWFLGAITDENARPLLIDLGFLSPGVRYRARLYADGDHADWKSRPEPVQVTEFEVSSDQSLAVALAAGGGAAVHFTPIPEE